MNVLSLFDGMSCGQIALKKSGIKYKNYYASEILPEAIKLTQHHFPNTIQLGEVEKIEWKNLPKIDLILAGSPCQGFSFAGKQLAFDDPRSKLFFEFVKALQELEPRYFLLENVKMKKEYEDVITNILKVNPIEINSASVSAQNRKRLYWTNIPNVFQPKDKGIMLSDVINLKENNYVVPKNWDLRVPPSHPIYVDPYNKKEIFNKSTALRTNVHNGNMWIKVKEGYRKLTRYECEMLQTVPIGYTLPISETQAKKCLGNGWTVDVIVHILKKIKF